MPVTAGPLMLPTKLSATALRRNVESVLKEAPGCRGVKDMSVYRAYGAGGVTWDAAVVDPGSADPAHCAAALRSIVQRLRKVYQLP
jgi:hypothetical protein